MASTSHSEPRQRVLILDPIHPDGIQLLQAAADIDVYDGPALNEVDLCSRVSPYHAVITRARTPITAQVIAAAPNLRIIARAGSSTDNIDFAAAEARGIEVTPLPDAAAVAAAEMTLALIFGVARRISRADQSVKAGDWEPAAYDGVGLAGKTLGIVGLGRVGREVARRALALGMRVVVNQTRATSELAEEWRVEQVDLRELLRRADFVSLHVPMRAVNHNLIGATELASMKPTAYLINTARGGLVDEAALLHALETGQIAGAALDVFADEPRPNPALVRHPHVLATPHIAGSTEDARRSAAVTAAERVLAVLGRQRRAEALSLRLVPSDKVFPHERFHPARVERLKKRLTQEGRLINPPIVAEMSDGRYVVLDGATRVTAFKQLAIPHIIVQVVDLQRGNVKMNTWFHAIHGGRGDSLVQVVSRVDGVKLTPTPVDHLPHALWERSALAYLITAERSGYLLELIDRDAGDWIDVLVELVDAYGAWGDVGRTLDTDMDALCAQYSDLAGLVVYPQFSPEIVIQVAERGRLLPAGITRFLIPGRILRLNAPLDVLATDVSHSAKADWLDRIVEEKLANRGVRYYEEPVMLLDE
ncbi:MAG: NAD(P)-dependent oxidoreductase [Caldilinea sp.]